MRSLSATVAVLVLIAAPCARSAVEVSVDTGRTYVPSVR